ncbi:MAG: hypothetical protein WA191_06875 [Telluria sp.]
MKITKMTAVDGGVFHTDKQMSVDDIRSFAVRVGGLHQVDIIEMTEAEYFAIAATPESAALFSQI